MEHKPWQPGEPVLLESRRLVVRSLKTADITPEVLRWSSEPAVAGNVWHPPHLPSSAYYEALIAASDQRSRFAFAIVHRRTQRLIGYVKLQVDPQRRVQIPTVAIGEPEFRQAKLGTEAVRSVQRFAFESLAVDAIESRVYAENESVRGLLTRAGYEEVTTYSEALPGRQPRRVHVYRIGKHEWLADPWGLEARLARLPDAPAAASC